MGGIIAARRLTRDFQWAEVLSVSGRTELPSGLVTFMFTDIEGSTRLSCLLGRAYTGILRAHRALVRAAVADFGGAELGTEGDSFFVAFGDAAAAVSACVAAQRALATHPWPSPEVRPKVRMGLHTGWAVPLGDEYISHEVHRAARVAAAAHGDQILCSEATARAANIWAPDAVPVVSWPRPRVGGLALRPAPVPVARAVAAGRPALRVAAGVGTATDGTATDSTAFDSAALDSPALASTAIDLGRFALRGFDDHERLLQVQAPGLCRDFPRPRTPDAPTHNLPALLSSFVGRQAELAEVVDLLDRHRLLSLLGPGGSGKTRLALATARHVCDEYAGGVWFVDCASAAAGLAEAVLTALGLRTEPGRAAVDTVVEKLHGRRTLLVVDTVEAAPPATAATVRQLLEACPQLRVLVTGRQPLGIRGERGWRIPPMTPVDTLALLRDRATHLGYPSDVAALAERLAGLPLAVELAADRLRLVSAAQLLARLEDPIAALDPDPYDLHPNDPAWLDAGPLDPTACDSADPDSAAPVDPEERHAGLGPSVAWSYRTLRAPAARLLRRLAVFPGPVELSTVERCATGAGPESASSEIVAGGAAPGVGALAALAELAEKSLVEVLPGPRYQISAPVRAYALRRFAAAGEYAAARDHQLGWALQTLDAVSADPDELPRTGGELVSRSHRSPATDVAPDELAEAYLIQAGLAIDGADRDRELDLAQPYARRSRDPTPRVRAPAGRRITLGEQGRCAEAHAIWRAAIPRAEPAYVASAVLRSTVLRSTVLPSTLLPSSVALAELRWRRGARAPSDHVAARDDAACWRSRPDCLRDVVGDEACDDTYAQGACGGVDGAVAAALAEPDRPDGSVGSQWALRIDHRTA